MAHREFHFRIAAVLAAVILAAGCTSTRSLRPRGMARVYHHPLPAVYAAAKTAAQGLKLEIVEEAPDHSFFTAKHGVSLASWGELVGVYFVAPAAGITEVTVRDKPRVATAISVAPRYAWKLHNALPPLLARLPEGVVADAGKGTTGPAPAAPRPVAQPVVAARGDSYALVIGIDNYTALPRLATARSDARAVAAVLEEAYGFRVSLLLDATRADILRALRSQRRLTSRDSVLIFYAGHGWLDERADEGYWLPVDADQTDNVNWIPNATITAAVRAIEARHVMIIADSCYSGKLTRGIQAVSRQPDYYRRLAERKARVVLSSGGLEPVIDAGGEGAHSIFASALLDVLSGNTGILDGVTLFGEVREKVGWNADQVPEYGVIHKAGHDGGDFLFRRRP